MAAGRLKAIAAVWTTAAILFGSLHLSSLLLQFVGVPLDSDSIVLGCLDGLSWAVVVLPPCVFYYADGGPSSEGVAATMMWSLLTQVPVLPHSVAELSSSAEVSLYWTALHVWALCAPLVVRQSVRAVARARLESSGGRFFVLMILLMLASFSVPHIMNSYYERNDYSCEFTPGIPWAEFSARCVLISSGADLCVPLVIAVVAERLAGRLLLAGFWIFISYSWFVLAFRSEPDIGIPAAAESFVALSSILLISAACRSLNAFVRVPELHEARAAAE